ncbi:uncharacterized protein MELLADRAFT_105569 [Melampsora larici-populina 98AG31]|uniref:Uncharacterized protein n=1 Tax=Melampsora larici-populina (strain 98AG31 / pathotype 3-4-7) TaxID=747676 RepID=F4RIN1_MELLP|nr:uncharacterized protein MELLADRAFT_105569 [Melampsora larici-populina 98AG31]EGG07805.1 hypothetical protein MELLADRAFT_105569 [Melampsora larici-populina 98AG31]
MQVEKFKAACKDPSSDQVFIDQFINQPLTSIPIIISNINFQANLRTENEIIERQRALIILKRTIENIKNWNPKEIQLRDDLLKFMLNLNGKLNHQNEETEVDQKFMEESNEIISQLIKIQCLTNDLTDLDSLLIGYNLNLSTIYLILKSISSISNLRSKLIIKRYSNKHFLEFFEHYQNQQQITLNFEIISILSIESFEESQLQELSNRFESDLLSMIINSTTINEELILQYSNFFLNSNQINQTIINTYSTIIQHPQLSKGILIKACEIILQALDSWSSSQSIELTAEQLYSWSNLIVSLFSVNPEDEEHSIPSSLFEYFSRIHQFSFLLLIQNLSSETQHQLSIKVYTFGLWIGSIKQHVESTINLELILNNQFNNLFVPILQSINDHNIEECVIDNLAFTMRKIIQNHQVSNLFRSQAEWILIQLYIMNPSYLTQLSTLDELVIGEEGVVIDWSNVLECLSEQLKYDLEAYTFLKTLICSNLSLMNGSVEKFCDLIIKTWTIELNETLKERLMDSFNDLIMDSFQILIQSVNSTESTKLKILKTFSQLQVPTTNLISSLILLIPIQDLFQFDGLFGLIQNSIQKHEEDEDEDDWFVLIRLVILSSAFDMSLLMNHKDEISNLFNLLIHSTKDQEKVCKLFLDLCVLNLNVFLETLNLFPSYYQTLFNQWKSLFKSTNLQIDQKKIVKSFKLLGEMKVYEGLLKEIQVDEDHENEEDDKVNEDENEWGEKNGLGRFGSYEFVRLKTLKDHLKNMINLDCFEDDGSRNGEYLLSNSSCESDLINHQEDQSISSEMISHPNLNSWNISESDAW